MVGGGIHGIFTEPCFRYLSLQLNSVIIPETLGQPTLSLHPTTKIKTSLPIATYNQFRIFTICHNKAAIYTVPYLHKYLDKSQQTVYIQIRYWRNGVSTVSSRQFAAHQAVFRNTNKMDFFKFKHKYRKYLTLVMLNKLRSPTHF